MPPERVPDRAPREEYASEQVKDLLELYFRDPYAFDQYARTYYYGERAERSAVVTGGGVSASRGYYDKRPDMQVFILCICHFKLSIIYIISC